LGQQFCLSVVLQPLFFQSPDLPVAGWRDWLLALLLYGFEPCGWPAGFLLRGIDHNIPTARRGPFSPDI